MKRFSLGCLGFLVVFVGGVYLLAYILSFYNDGAGVDADFRESALRANPPPPLAEPVELKLVTFNIQDLYVVAYFHEQRMRAIAEVLTELDPDIVGFQEAFIGKHRAVLKEALAGSRLQHHQYYESATMGSGLLISSAFPIEEAHFHRFTESNPWYKLWEGDWWAGKGVAHARIRLPDGQGYVDFYNTHAQAGYGNPYYRIVRASQMRELAGFINESRIPAAPAFLVGDMNCRPGSEDYELAMTQARLTRLMTVPSAIDHIFGVEDPRYEFETRDSIEIDEYTPVFGGRLNWPVSDHYGYLSTIRVTPTNAETP